MVSGLFKDNAARYKPEDWENDPLETTVSPDRSANARILTYHFMCDVGMKEKPINMPDIEWGAYQEWLKAGKE